MINLQTLLSTFDEKGTLLKWLKKVEAALANASLETVQVVVVDATHIKMKFVFADGTSVESPSIALPRGPQGVQGEQGPQGPIGPTGPQGATGAQGPQGIQGVQGPKGEKGDDGNSFVIVATIASVVDLPTSAPAGEAYFVGTVAPRDVYTFDALTHSWVNQGKLQGPKGDTGETGPQGPQGPQGATGAQGPQGIQGIQGPKGDKGDKGDTGSTGATPNISVTATELPAGSSPTATRSGTDENPIITFGIPQASGGGGFTPRLIYSTETVSASRFDIANKETYFECKVKSDAGDLDGVTFTANVKCYVMIKHNNEAFSFGKILNSGESITKSLSASSPNALFVRVYPMSDYDKSILTLGTLTIVEI